MHCRPDKSGYIPAGPILERSVSLFEPVGAAIVQDVKDASFSQNSYYTLHFPLPTHLIGFVRYVFV